MAKQITELRTKLSMDKDDFSRSSKETKADLKALKSEMNFVKASTDGYGNSLTGLKKQSDILNRTLRVQESQLASIKKKYDEAVKASGENSAEARRLQAQYNNVATQIKRTELRLESVNSSISEQSNRWKRLSRDAKRAGDNIKDTGDRIQSFGQNMTQNVTAPIVGFGALATETTREFRADLAKLNINAKQAGFGIKDMDDSMRALNAITGETDSNVEALSNLIATGMDKNQLKQAVDDLSGAVIKFPDTLKIEGVADGLQETLATGKAIGPFAELLERMGVDLETFDEGLADAKGSGDELNYVLGKLNDLDLSKVNKEFRETNKELVDAREAQYDFQASFAELGKKLEPIATRITEGLTDMINKFNELDPETQDMIIKFGGIAAISAPVVTGIGSITKATGNLFGGISKVAGKIGKKGGGAGTLLGGLGLLAGGGGVIGLATLAIGGLTAGGIALYNHLKDEVVPEVDLFGESVSESTQKALGGFMELNDQATVQLNELNWTGKEVTEEMAESLTTTFDEMGQMIVEGLQVRKEESITALEELFARSKTISEEEQVEMLQNVTEGYEERKVIIEEGQARIDEILTTAAEENRARTEAEEKEINEIKQRMMDTALETLTESQREQKVILEQMEQQSGAITARQASEVIKNSAKQKNEVVAEAQKQYDLAVAEAIRQRDETGDLTAQQADAVIKEAKRQKDETIKKADEMHQGVIDSAKENRPEIVGEVNTTTGDILSKWDKLKIDVVAKLSGILSEARTIWGTVKTIFSEKLSFNTEEPPGHAKGTSYFSHPSGKSWLGEEGAELVRHGNKWALADFGLYNVPHGAQIYTHEETKKILNAMNKYPKHATGVSPNGEADRIANRLSEPQPMRGEAVIYTTVINQIDGEEISRNTYKRITELQELDKNIRESFA